VADLDARVTDALAAAVAERGPHLVHTNNLAGITTGVWGACARAGVPVVHTLHDYSLLCARATLVTRAGERCRPRALGCGFRARRLQRWTPGVRSVIGVSRHVLSAHSGFFADGVTEHVVLHPRPAALAEGVREAPGERLRTLGYLGALDVVKGVGALLEALPALATLGIRVRVAGAGRLRPVVEQAAAAGRLDYEGVVGGGAKQRFLEACDAGIVPSVWDEPGAPPYVALEWLGARRPVLASRRGGLGEAAEELAGLHPLDPTAGGITDACRALLDPAAWTAAVAAASAPVVRAADDERWLDDHANVYEALLERR
jgi:glycosyltransferase involved in cell wall biosynthesis